MVKIKGVHARTVVIPMGRSVAFSTRAVPARAYTLVRVECDDDTYGLGVCQHGGSRFGTMPTDAIRTFFSDLVVGENPYRVEGIWADLYQEVLHSGRHGAVMRGLSALDIALWDRNARTAGLPLWAYLGSARTDSVPAYASGGYYYADGSLDDLVAEVQGHLDAGFRALKMKVGRVEPAQDAERMRLVREVLGDDAPLMLDANNRWKDDLPGALRALRHFEPHEPYWIEEPFGPEDVANHARLVGRTAIPVATGELLGGRWSLHAFLQAEAVGVLQPDAGVCGGITEFRRVAATAASHGIPVAPHSLEDVHVHLVAATPNATFVECFPNEDLHPMKRVVDARLETTASGEVRLPTGPGLGIEFIDDEVDRYAIDEWS